MAYTQHGYHIPGTMRGDGRPEVIVRCGGLEGCLPCSREAIRNITSRNLNTQNEYCDDKTMYKVLNALMDSGLTGEQAETAYRKMVDAHILFRELR